MTLNGVVAVILRYFTEFGSFRGALHRSGSNGRRRWPLHVWCMYVCMYLSFGQGSSLLWTHTL